jgi:hypothetical protein
MNLQQIQTAFQQHLIDEHCTGPGWIATPSPGLTAQARLGVYHHAYRARLIDVLFDTFSHTAAYLGDDWFRQLAATYVQHNLSGDPNIGQYGTTFAAYVAQDLPDDPDVAELALIDWTLRRAFDGPDARPLTHDALQQLAQQPDEAIRLQPVPTLTLLTQRSNSLHIWRAIDTDEQPPQAETLKTPITVLVWRKGHAPHFRSTTPFESCALGIVESGRTLNHLGESLSTQFPDIDVAVQFGELLGQWIDDQLLTECRT